MIRIAGSLALGSLVAACGSTVAPTPPSPSVLVGVVRPNQGSLPEVVTAYGTATPSLTASRTLSVAQPGQVTALSVVAGSSVRAGQTLMVFAAAPTAISGYTQAKTAVSTARQSRATTAQLVSQQLATRDQLAQADKAVADANAAIAALREEGAGQPVQTLRAPFDGTVVAIPVAQGDRVQPGAALATIARAGGIVVTVGVDPGIRTRVHGGQPVTIERLNGGIAVPGRVVRVAGALNARTRLVDVDVGFPAGAILPGESLRVLIGVGAIGGWVVPHRAVVTANGDARVYQVKNGKAVPVKVAVVLSSPQGDVVQGEIDRKRQLIVDGAYQVHDGEAVRWVADR